MNLGRRGLLQALTISGFRTASNADEPALSLNGLRAASVIHGTNLSDVRLSVIKPALERRRSELRALRHFEVDDAVGPAPGILTE